MSQNKIPINASPYPWKILFKGDKKDGPPFNIVDLNGWSVYDLNNANGLCINCYLIATAPDLLKAAKDIYNNMISDEEGSDGTAIDIIFNRLPEIIKRAKGL